MKTKLKYDLGNFLEKTGRMSKKLQLFTLHSDFIKPLKQIVIWQEEQRNINEGYKSIFADDASVNDL